MKCEFHFIFTILNHYLDCNAIIEIGFFPLCRPFIKSVIQGFLPGIVLKLFLIFLPTILMIMSKFEGFTSISSLERRSATRYYLFNLVNVFLGSVIAGSALDQLNTFIKQSANESVFLPFYSVYVCYGFGV